MNILTAADVLMAERGLPPTIYDAYLLFHDEDIEFATTIVDKMQEYGLTVTSLIHGAFSLVSIRRTFISFRYF